LLNVIFSKSQKYAFLYCTVRKKYVDVEDLKNEVHYNIAVARYTKHHEFTGVRTNPEHPNLKPFIQLQFTVVTAVSVMKLRHPVV